MSSPAVVPFPRPPRKPAAAQRREREAERERELKLKRSIDRSGQLLDRLEARAARYKAAAALAKQRAELACARAERIENAILERMQRANLQKLVGNAVTLSQRLNAPGLQVVDQRKVPSQFIRTKVTEEVDKAAAKVALARGEDVPGVKLVQTVSLIRS